MSPSSPPPAGCSPSSVSDASSSPSSPPLSHVPSPVHAHFVDRLKQTLAMASQLFMFLFQPFCFMFFSLVFLPFLWPLFLLYLCWYIWDFNAPSHGSHFCPSIYNSFVWCHLANYFPISVVKTAELPTDRNYVFSSHPHGIFGMSSFIFFGTNGANFASLFPGLRMHSVTLDVNFKIPIRREIIMASRMIPSDSKAIEWVLSRPGGGYAVGIVPGGAAEAMESYPGTNRVITARRKGFIKLAIKHGASIVPVYHFGETDTYEQRENHEGSTLWTVQKALKRLTGISFPLAYGQSFLASLLPEETARKLPRWLRFGIFPFRRRIVTVVGKPMEIEKNAQCDEQTVNRIHAEYCQRLRELFDEHKVKLGGLSKNCELEFV